MEVKLYGDRVYAIFKPIEESKVGVIIVPDKHSERSRLATIMAIGEEVINYDVGDTILVSTYTGVRLHLVGKELFGEKVNEETHRILREEEILAKCVEN